MGDKKWEFNFEKTLKWVGFGVVGYIGCLAIIILSCLAAVGALFWYFVTSPLVQGWLGY